MVQEPLYDPGERPSEIQTGDVQMSELPSTLHNNGNYITEVVYA